MEQVKGEPWNITGEIAAQSSQRRGRGTEKRLGLLGFRSLEGSLAGATASGQQSTEPGLLTSGYLQRLGPVQTGISCLGGGVPVKGPCWAAPAGQEGNRKPLVLPLPSTFCLPLAPPRGDKWLRFSVPGHVPSLLMNLFTVYRLSCAADSDPGGWNKQFSSIIIIGVRSGLKEVINVPSAYTKPVSLERNISLVEHTQLGASIF